MSFKNLDKLHGYNEFNSSNNPFNKARTQFEQAINSNGNSYFEQITRNCQSHKAKRLDWQSYYCDQFADTFLPAIENEGENYYSLYDGASLFERIEKLSDPPMYLTADLKVIKLVIYTYPEGVNAAQNKELVYPKYNQICTFMEIDQNNEILISFKFGDDFRQFLSEDKRISSRRSIDSMEKRIQKTTPLKLEQNFKGKISHKSMFNYILDSIGVKFKTDNFDLSADFVPIVLFDESQKQIGFTASKKSDEKAFKLSELLDIDKQIVKVKELKLQEDSIIEFKVEKGNKRADDNGGVITFLAKGVEFMTDTNKEIRPVNGVDEYDSRFDFSYVEYDWKLRLKLSARTVEEGAYIDIYANDNDKRSSAKDTHCGRILVTEGKQCTCSKSKPAGNFEELVDLVKKSEEVLAGNHWDEIGDRISIIRGIYYGTEWSLDYQNEKSSARNFAFNEYTNSNVVADARKELKCSTDCNAHLFDSLYNSYEVFDNDYKAVDFGHLIIGLDSRRSWRAVNVTIPTQGGTGLELNTWVGDLGGGTGKLAKDRVENPNKRAKEMFQVYGHSYGSMVNLEGDVAAYVVGVNLKDESDISDVAENYETIHEALQDYFENKWDKRAYYFLKMLEGEFDGTELTNKGDVLGYCAFAIEDFAYWYSGIRYGLEDMVASAYHYRPVSFEMAIIFIDGLLHTMENPNDMITCRTDPDPLPEELSSAEKIEEMIDSIFE